jgi:hypothetical protein
MRKLLLLSGFYVSTTFALSGAAHAGFELVCNGGQARTNLQPVYVDCTNRNDFINTLGRAWQTLRESNVAGTLEDLCWEAYSDARDMHPSISFHNISDAFLMRCNMGLEYTNN